MIGLVLAVFWWKITVKNLYFAIFTFSQWQKFILKSTKIVFHHLVRLTVSFGDFFETIFLFWNYIMMTDDELFTIYRVSARILSRKKWRTLFKKVSMNYSGFSPMCSYSIELKNTKRGQVKCKRGKNYDRFPPDTWLIFFSRT